MIQFAPYSHDAESGDKRYQVPDVEFGVKSYQVPDGGTTLVLLGLGIFSLGSCYAMVQGTGQFKLTDSKR